MILSSCHSQSIAVLAATALLPTLHAFSLDRTFEESCSAFASEVDIPNVKVHFSQYLPTGYNLSIPDFPQSYIESQGSSPSQYIRAGTCRVALLVNTSDSSSMTLEAWLPSNWTGRFLSGGNGGLSGCIQYVGLSYGSASGFATVSGNNGHDGSSAAPMYQQPSFDPETLTREDFAVAASQDPYNISTFDADLSAFQGRGGKFLTFHGMEDFIISSEISTMYYHRLAETMSLPPSSLDSFYRYFRVGGLSHCALGSGAYGLGMYSFGSIQNAMEQDPDDNVLARIVAWVERGEAPEYIRGTSFKGGGAAGI